MINAKKYTRYFHSSCFFLLFVIGILAFTTDATAATPVIQKDTANRDSIVHDGMSPQKSYQERHINSWNKTIPKYKDVAGTSTVYSSDVNTTPVSDITNVMAGRLPGLYSIQYSGRTGAMFDASTIKLRGQTPLIVIDGVVRSFTAFNPNDIKSITVMDDALSASMFGLRSSNGVIYITTKDRSDSRPFELNFNAQFGKLEHLDPPNFITGYNYAKLYNEAQLNSFPGAQPTYTDAMLSAYQNGTNNPYTNPNTNWYSQIYKNNSSQQRYSIDAAGNGKNFRYYTSIEEFQQGGNFVTSPDNLYNTNNDYSRFNVRTNAQIDFSENIQLSLNIFGSSESYNEPGATANTIINNAYATSPFAYPVYNADGSYGGNALYTNNIIASTLGTGYITTNQRAINADVGVKFKLDNLTKGLWAKGFASVNNSYAEQLAHTKTFAVYSNPVTTSTGTTYTKYNTDGVVAAGGGRYTSSTLAKQTYLSGLAGYDRSFGKNNISLLATYNNDNTLNSLTQLNLIYQTLGLTGSYDYDKTYLAQIGLAYSSLNRYPPGHQWGLLPSLGLGWVVSNQKWFKTSVLSYFKVRGSVGQTAWADPANYYIYLQTYTINASGYTFGTASTAVSAAKENTLASDNLTWEKAWKWDAGFEAGFLNNKLNATVNYYDNRYYDQLQQVDNGNGTGILGQTYPLENIRKSKYYGIETSLGFNQTISKSVSYFLKGNLSIAQSKLVFADEPNYPYPWLYQAGGAVGQTIGYQAIGFYQTGEDVSKSAHILGYTPVAGDLKYQDLNGDGVIDFRDQKPIAGTKPLVFFGLNLGVNVSNFDLSALFQGVTNRQITLSPTSMSAFSNSYGYVLDYTTDNHWTPQNTTGATLPRLTLGSNSNNQVASSFWVRNANYLRLKNVELGYTIPSKLLSRAKISKLRVFVNGYNLFTWTQLAYMDPESGLSGFTNQRIINGGISLKL
jgi:TonB-linked SusC/RagA family outer membrane protein